MNKIERVLFFVSMFLVCFFSVALALSYLPTPQPIAAQATTLESRVKVLETAQASLLKRVGVLETAAMSHAVTSTVQISTTTGASKTDDLGIPYGLTETDLGIKVVGWEAYENHNGHWSVAGSVQNKHETDRFSMVYFKVRFYKKQRLIQVEGFGASGPWIDPGKTLPFEFASSIKPGEFDRYTVEVTAGDWSKKP